jgi:hypothetical protein
VLLQRQREAFSGHSQRRQLLPEIGWYGAVGANAIIAQAAERAPLQIRGFKGRQHFVKQASERCLLGISQGRQKVLDCRETLPQQLFTKRCTLLSEIKCDCPFVAPIASLNETVGNEPIYEADCARMRQAKNASQLVVGWAKAIANDDQCSRGFASVMEDVARRFLDAVRHSKPHDAQQIGSAINHPAFICAQRTFFNLTLCAPRTYF